jgi:hypothetical protein
MNKYPMIGKEIGAAAILKELVMNGHQLILFTMRCDSVNENYLSDAVNWFKQNEIELYGTQTNPTQLNWTTSPKAYAHLYIDDDALGCPLVHGYFDDKLGRFLNFERPHVDWVAVKEILISKGFIKTQLFQVV